MWPRGGARSSSRTSPTSVFSLASGPPDGQKGLLRRVLLFIMVCCLSSNFYFCSKHHDQKQPEGEWACFILQLESVTGGLRVRSLEADTEAEARNAALMCSPWLAHLPRVALRTVAGNFNMGLPTGQSGGVGSFSQLRIPLPRRPLFVSGRQKN